MRRKKAMNDAAREQELLQLLAVSEQLEVELRAMVDRLDGFADALIDDAMHIRGSGDHSD